MAWRARLDGPPSSSSTIANTSMAAFGYLSSSTAGWSASATSCDTARSSSDCAMDCHSRRAKGANRKSQTRVASSENSALGLELARGPYLAAHLISAAAGHAAPNRGPRHAHCADHLGGANVHEGRARRVLVQPRLAGCAAGRAHRHAPPRTRSLAPKGRNSRSARPSARFLAAPSRRFGPGRRPLGVA